MYQAAYRNAFDSASAELSEIVSQFDQLRMRKERIEKMVEALKPLMQEAAQVSAQAAQPAAQSSAPEKESHSSSPEQPRQDEGPSDYHFLKIGESAQRFQPAATGWPSILPRH